MASSSDSRPTAANGADAYTRSLDCVHCGLCLPACPTHRVLGVEADSPRGRIYLMRALFENRVGDPAAIRPFLDRCLDCRACETACPSGVRYGEILESTRARLEQIAPARGAKAWLTRVLLWHVVARPRRLRFAVAALGAAERLGLRWLAERLGLLPPALAALVPRVPPRRERQPLAPGRYLPPPGTTRRGPVVALFTGCIMAPMFGRVHRATLEVLRRNGFTVDVPAAQRCCGALLLHSGQPDRARELARANLAAFATADVVLNNSAGCGAAMKGYGHLLGDPGRAFAARCLDVSEFLARHGLTAAPAPRPVRVVYDDPCHLCHGQGVRAAPRELLRQVPGLQLVDHDDPEACCGSAGIYNLLQVELAAAIGRQKAEAIRAAAPALVATGNPGCMMQIDSHLRRIGHPLPVCHPIELLVPPP